MIDLLAGKKSLFITYWVGVVGFGLLVRIGSWFMTHQYHTTIDEAKAEKLIIGYDVFIVVCTVIGLLLLRAMVKAGFNNRKPGGWGWLGIAIAGLGVANMGHTSGIVRSLSGSTPKSMLQREIAELSKQLPREMDEETTMTGVEIIGDDMVYFFSHKLPLIPDRIPDMKREFGTGGIEGQSACRAFERYFRGGLENVVYEFTYTNQSVTIELSAQDCLSFLANR